MAQRFQPLIEEDLNVGTEAVWVGAPGGGQIRATQIGLHTVARGQLSYSATWAPGVVPAGDFANTTLTVPDATIGDFVMASHDKMLTNDLSIFGHVEADDTVQVIIFNPTAADVTVASGTVAVLVFPAFGAVLPTSEVNGTVFENDGTTPWVGGAVSMTVDGEAWPGGDATTNGSGAYQFLEVQAGAIAVAAAGGNNSGLTVPPATLTLDIILPPV